MTKKKTDDKTQEKAITLFVISESLQTITAAIIENGGEVDENTMELLTAWREELAVKAQSIAQVLQRLDGDAGYYKAVEDAARARRKAVEGAQTRLKQYLARNMEETGTKQIKERGVFTISLCDGRSTATIVNEGDLPMDLVETVVTSKPDRKRIKELLESGEEVPGAVLEYGEKYVMIRGGSGCQEEKGE